MAGAAHHGQGGVIMDIAFLGTRGVPAHYGGFETAIEEIGQRLVARGHRVTVYCRRSEEPAPSHHLGMRLVHLPAIHRKSLETLSHTFLSALHLVASRRRHDAVFVCNAANAPFLPLLRLGKAPIAVHVDGLEWKRAKWQGIGRRYYRVVESLSVRWADALIADAVGIADYYADEFRAPTDLLAYGAPILLEPGASRIKDLDLEPAGFHVVVARFEPENHVAEIVEGYRASSAELPLVVVGSAPYADEYTNRVKALAHGDPRIRLVGGIWDQQQLDELYANALTYVHGHSVGGTNPSLLRAIGAGTAVLAFDVNFNREVLGDIGHYFATPSELAPLFEKAESDQQQMKESGELLRDRAARDYRWDDVALGYEALAAKLRNGHSTRGVATGRRSKRAAT